MTAPIVVAGTPVACDKGAAPTPLLVPLPLARVFAGKLPAARVSDAKPIVNIVPFGSCALLSGAPCVPATVSWSRPSERVKAGGEQLVTKDSTCACQVGGTIRVVAPAQTTARA